MVVQTISNFFYKQNIKNCDENRTSVSQISDFFSVAKKILYEKSLTPTKQTDQTIMSLKPVKVQQKKEGNAEEEVKRKAKRAIEKIVQIEKNARKG